MLIINHMIKEADVLTIQYIGLRENLGKNKELFVVRFVSYLRFKISIKCE